MSKFTLDLVVSVFLLGLIPLAYGAEFEYRIKRSSWNTTPPASALPGSGGNPSTGDSGENTSGTPGATPAPRVELSTKSLDFGNQATHTMVKSQILMTNTGSAPLQIIAPPSLTGSSAFGLGLTSCSGTLAPNQSCMVEVVYAPQAVVVDAGWVAFSTNASTSPVSTSLKGASYNPVTLAAATIPGAPLSQDAPTYSYDFKQHLGVANESAPDKVMASWTIVSGSLPPGLTLSNIGVLSGRATTQTTTTVRLRVEYRSNVAEQSYTLKSGTVCYIMGECTAQPAPTGPLTQTPGPTP